MRNGLSTRKIIRLSICPPNWLTNRLSSRGGFSLVELLVVMTVMSVLLGVVVTLLTTLLHESRTASHQREAQISLGRFAAQFRADVHASKLVELEEASGTESRPQQIVLQLLDGARVVYTTEISDYRLDLAMTVGADLTLNPLDDDVAGILSDATESEGVDVLFEMSGAPAAIETGFAMLKPGGVAALLGLPGKKIEFDFDDNIIFKGATVYGIVGRRISQTWLEMRGLIRSGAVDLSPIVTHRFAFDDYEKAFELMGSGQCGKVIMFPDPSLADGLLS